MSQHRGSVQSLEELRTLYPQPSPLVRRKVRPALDTHCCQVIAESPLVFLATADARGRCDVSPRGDAPGFVRVLDDHTLVLPDRLGNNRLDALRNLLSNDHVGLLFVIPGRDDTLRVNGRAVISTNSELLAAAAVSGRAPVTVLVITIEEAYLHCGRSFQRGSVWSGAKPGVDLPGLAEMLADQVGASQEERKALLAAVAAADLY